MGTNTSSTAIKAVVAAIIVAMLAGAAALAYTSGAGGSAVVVGGTDAVEVAAQAAAEDAEATSAVFATRQDDAPNTDQEASDEIDEGTGAENKTEDATSDENTRVAGRALEADSNAHSATPVESNTDQDSSGSTAGTDVAPAPSAGTPSSSGPAIPSDDVAPPGSCPPGAVLMPNGTCVLTPVPGELPELPGCPAGTVATPDGCVREPQTQCPAGSSAVGSTCQRPAEPAPAPTECPAGTIAVGDQCLIPDCSAGFQQIAGKCIRIPAEAPAECPAGTIAVGNQCLIPDCNAGYRWNGTECVEITFQCGAGETRIGDDCVTPDPTCDPWYFWDGAICAPVITECADGSTAVGEPCPTVLPTNCPTGNYRIFDGPCIPLLDLELVDIACLAGQIPVAGTCLDVSIDPDFPIDPDLFEQLDLPPGFSSN